MSEIRWEVYSDLIPLSGRPTPIGEVLAPDKPTALLRAAETHGPRIVVQSVASRKVAARELTMPVTRKRTREEVAQLLRENAARTRRRKAQLERRQHVDTPVGARPGDFHRAKAALARDAEQELPAAPTHTETTP